MDIFHSMFVFGIEISPLIAQNSFLNNLCAPSSIITIFPASKFKTKTTLLSHQTLYHFHAPINIIFIYIPLTLQTMCKTT